MEILEIKTSVLNDLIQINNDRIEGYKKAVDELNDQDVDLRALFQDMIQESRDCRAELAQEVARVGEVIETGTTNSGKIYRAWMDVRASFSGNTRKAVLANCEAGEDAAQRAYEMAEKTDDLPSDTRFLITQQKLKLKLSHDKIKALRDAEV